MATPLDELRESQKPGSAHDTHGLSADQLIGIYRNMYTSRAIDDREILMKRQNRVYFQISGAGHEAVLTAAGMVTRPGYDWFFPYYRDRALALQLGVTPYEMFLQAVGAADDPASGGRQMPAHFGHKTHNIVTASSPTGTQFLQAVGAAEAAVRADRFGVEYQGDELVVVCTGEGTTSEGEFWESMNTASNLKLPVIYLVEDNGYAISVPVEVNTAGGSISRLVQGFPDLLVQEVDGTDPLASYQAMKQAEEHCRARRGPALVHAHVIRPYSHSMSDDERLYKPEEEREAEAHRDPLVTFPKRLAELGIATEDQIQAMREAIDAEVMEAADRAMERSQPTPDTIYLHLFSDEVDPTSEAFDTEPQFEGDPTTMVDLLNACLRDEMARDPRIVVYGEDVADVSRDQYLEQVKGKGGVFKVTAGLQRRFGSHRVYNSPLAEANIVGRAVGMSVFGLKPVAEVQFFDYIWPAFHQLRNEITTMRWRSNGAFPFAERGGAVRAHAGDARGLSGHRTGCERIAPDGHPL
jgi:2-oxoisovalerate dehydrogenase E1 component